jgi:predicted TIM-barrel fold metal-dependent hydrolase
MSDRRTFLKTLAAAGAASLVPSGDLFGQARVVRLNARGGAIDVHHHFQPPGTTGNRPWSPELSLEQMEKFGIAVAILSMTQNGDLLYDGTEKGRTAVRRGNEYGAKLMQEHPTKFGLMGGIPMPDVEGALKEIEYAYDTLKVDAIGIYSNDNKGRWPGDPYFEPMWQELNRRNAIVYMHPLAPQCCRDLKYGPAASMVEFDFDVTRGVASIVVNGVMFRYPNIRFITVHSGGTVPMLAGRMKDRVPAGAEKYMPNGLYAELRKWYYDIAHATFPWPYAAMKAFMPESQILFGTDYAPEPIESTVNELPGLKLAKDFEQMMLRGNAEKLFPRFAVRRPT